MSGAEQRAGDEGARARKRVAVIAHRGGASLAPENTMAAFRKAAALGADMVELDVHLSADGVLVVFHDDTLERTTDIGSFAAEWGLEAPIFVGALPLDNLGLLDAGSWFVRDDPFGTIASGEVTLEEAQIFCGEPIPTLDRVLAFADECGLAVNVEIKHVPLFYEGIADKVAEAVGRVAHRDRVLVSSFDHEVLRRVHAIDSSIAVAPLASGRIADPGRYTREIVGGSAYHVSADALGCRDGRPAGAPLVNAGDIAAAHRFGVAVNVWTVNDPELMERLSAAGADGIVTDRPQVLKAVMGNQREA